MAADLLLIEHFDAYAKMIEVAAFLSGRRTARASEFPADRNQVDKGTSRTELDKSYGLLPLFDGAPEDLAVEAKHLVEVDNTKYQMIDVPYADHGVVEKLIIFSS